MRRCLPGIQAHSHIDFHEVYTKNLCELFGQAHYIWQTVEIVCNAMQLL